MYIPTMRDTLQTGIHRLGAYSDDVDHPFRAKWAVYSDQIAVRQANWQSVTGASPVI